MKKEYFYIVGSILVVALFFVFFASRFATTEQSNKVKLSIQNDNSDSEYVVDASDYIVAHAKIGDSVLGVLSDKEKAGLVKMRQEEKLAHDVYLVLYQTWGLNIFRNIASSEATHTEAVRYLLKRYSLVDPIKSEELGIFQDNEFSKLYHDLVDKGKESPEDALFVGALIEDLDINDLNSLIAETNNENVLEIYNDLARGSRNHLRAFNKQLQKAGKVYSAQYISAKEFLEIINMGQERG